MKNYRIAVNLNRITIPYEIDFEKAYLYHLSHGVEIEFIFREVDVIGYKSEKFTHQNGFVQYILSGADKLVDIDHSADANMFVFDMNEWANEEGSEFPLKPETPNGNCKIIDGKPFINIGTYITDHEIGETWIQIAHEIMHSYVQNAFIKGMPIPDVMDTYEENSNPDSPTGNFAKQWKLLEPYFT